ncbi:MAG: hypothetical protein Q7T25_13555, partial [Sideroxyarcus sp.]|nr:hypothetical protein [Sideroxyarcus sp.]
MIFVLLITAVVVAFGYVLERLQTVPFLFQYRSLIFAAVLLYIPLYIGHRNRKSLVFIETSFGQIMRSLWTFAIWTLIVFIPYSLGVHLWAKIFWGAHSFQLASLPPLNLILTQLLVVALPEESFFR